MQMETSQIQMGLHKYKWKHHKYKWDFTNANGNIAKIQKWGYAPTGRGSASSRMQEICKRYIFLVSSYKPR